MTSPLFERLNGPKPVTPSRPQTTDTASPLFQRLQGANNAPSFSTPSFSLPSNERSSEEIEKEQKERRRALLGDTPTKWGVWGVGSPLYALADMSYSFLQDAGQVLSGEGGGVGDAIGGAFATAGHLLNPLNLPSNLVGLAKGLGMQALNLGELALEALPGVDRLSPEEQNKKIQMGAVDVAAFYFGAKAVQQAKGAKLATDVGRKFGSLGDDAASALFDSAPKAVQAAALRGGVGETAMFRNALRVGRNASLAAAGPGLFYGDTPEERISNAVNFGVVAGMFGVLSGANQANKARVASGLHELKDGTKLAGWQNFKETIVQNRAAKIAAGIPEEFEGNIKDFDTLIGAMQEHNSPQAAASFLQRVIRHNTPENEIGLFTDLPLTDKGIALQGPKGKVGENRGWQILTYKNPVTKKQIALVAPEGQVLPLTKKEIAQFKATGFYEGMQAERAGQKYRVIGIKGGEATIQSGGKTLKVPLSDLKHSTSIGIERIVDLPQPEVFKFGSPEWAMKQGIRIQDFDPSQWAPEQRLDHFRWKFGEDVIEVSGYIDDKNNFFVDLIDMNGQGLKGLKNKAGALKIRQIEHWITDTFNVDGVSGDRVTGSRGKKLNTILDELEASDYADFSALEKFHQKRILTVPTKKAPKPFGIVKSIDDAAEFLAKEESDDILRLQETIANYKKAQVSNISSRAANAGYSIEYKDGKLLLRDLVDTTKEPVFFEHPKQIEAYIDTLNAHPAGDLVGINPQAPVELANIKASITPMTNMEARLAKLNLSWLSRKGVEFTQLNQSLQAMFPDIPVLKETFELERATRRLTARLLPWQKNLSEVFKEFDRAMKLKGSQLSNELVADFLDSLSFDEAISSNPKSRLFRGRDVTKYEIGHHEELLNLALKGVDDTLDPSAQNAAGLENLNAATTAIKRVLESSKKKNYSTPEQIHNALNALDDITPEQKAIANYILEKKAKYSGDLSTYSIYAPIELTRLKLSESLSKTDFAKKHGLTPNDLAALDKLRNWFEEVGTSFGITDNRKLNHYFPRVFTDVEGYAGRLPDNLKLLYEDSFFDHALHRVGVGVEYNKDIAHVTTNYIHNAARKEILLPAMKQFQKEVIQRFKSKEAAAANAHGKSFYHGEEIVNIMETHIRELQHFNSPSELMGELINKQFAERTGLPVKEYSQWADRLVGMISFSTMGANPLLGFRDVTSMSQAFMFKFGIKEFRRMVRLDNEFTSRLQKQSITDLLKAEGKTPNSLIRWLYKDLDDRPGGITAKVSEGLANTRSNIGEAAFKMTMQAQVYDKFQRMVYNWSMDRYTKAINDFQKHKDFKKFSKAIELDAHHAGVREAFGKMFDAGEFHKGGDFLAWSSAHETLSIYGQANHPIGWSSSAGRLFGQYGKWPLWAIRQIANNATGPGSGKRIARWATASAAIYGLGAGTGINFDQWVFNPLDMVYKGSPALQVTVDMINATTNGSPLEKEMAQQQMFGPLVNLLEGDAKLMDFKSPFIPVPYSIWNLLEGSGAIEPGRINGLVMDKHPELALMKMLGFSIAASGNSIFPGNPADKYTRASSFDKLVKEINPF